MTVLFRRNLLGFEENFTILNVNTVSAKAFRWASRAADLNSPIAQYNLGVMYLKGVYVGKDLRAAREYFAKAADNGHEDAAKILKKLK